MGNYILNPFITQSPHLPPLALANRSNTTNKPAEP